MDKQFNTPLDGLIVVDLKKVDNRMLEKYLGNKGMALFQNRHGYGTSDQVWREQIVVKNRPVRGANRT